MIYYTLKTLLVAALACRPVVQDLRSEAARNLVGRAATCVVVAVEADRWGVPADLALAVAWHESRFDYYAVGSSGEIGPLQALPRYWCRAKPCRPIVAGMRALAYHLGRFKSHRAVLSAYNGDRSGRYARKVLNTIVRWSKT